MANKYLRHGETYCGDGTTSAAATSNGGVGAWNNINVFTGSAPAYGALAAGDTVNLRSKDASAADITVTLGASAIWGSSSATTGSPITWVLDNGAIWSGVDGKLQYDCPSTYVVTLRNYNRFIAQGEDKLVIKETNTSPSYKTYLGGAGIYFKNLFCDFATTTYVGGNGSQLAAFTDDSTLENLHITSKKIPEYLIRCGTYSSITLINPRIDLVTATASAPVFLGASAGGYFTIIGGALTGAGATSAVPLCHTLSQGAKYRFFGFQFPNEMPLTLSAVTYVESSLHTTGSDGLAGVRMKEKWGEASSRVDAYLPTLNAQLPDDAGTNWAWWLYPSGASLLGPAKLECGKVFTETAGIRQIDLEVLIATAFTECNASNVWMSVSYTDHATGLPKYVSTLDPAGAALTTSTAAWYPDPPTYGATSYDKKVLSIETPTSIKKDTMIHVVLFVAATASSSSRTIIFCPDFVLTTP